ncbi:MAG: YggS family pyridoxal phosphate-dependent enzyme [Clostridium sp.]|uniref:YggS family pyridoxal phosphate-dependent enzyme n=1 Tax=Clostridium sp. TaxID=1506 RepID=UPI00321732CC|nr:YggS family pyridoxal phosphate-dependent enzyme [Clostridium sp.]
MDSYERYLEIKNSVPDDVTIVAVSKTRSIEDMEGAYRAGARIFGENKVRELIGKYDSFHEDVQWHLIGHLQRNKVKYLVGKVDLIQSLDSVTLLNEIEKQFGKEKIIANTLIEINIGSEESKAGVLLNDLESLLVEVEKCQYVKVRGLMAIIPKGDEESNRYYFKKVKELYERLQKKDFKNIIMSTLSMGMSGDYDIAISEGANMIRIGEGIFGKRNYK